MYVCVLQARVHGIPNCCLDLNATHCIATALQVVSALFDINPSMSTHMAVPLWKRCVGTLLEVLQLLQDEHWIQVDEFYEPPAEDRLEDPPAGQPAKVSNLDRRIRHFVLHDLSTEDGAEDPPAGQPAKWG